MALQTGAKLIQSARTLFATGTLLTALVCLRPTPLPAQGAAVADSLQLARTMAERRVDCVAAFALAARQLATASGRPDRIAPIFRTLSVVAHHGGDTGTSLVFGEAALHLANAINEPDAPQRAAYLLTQALAVRLSGRTGAKEQARDMINEGLSLATAATPSDRRALADLQQATANLARSDGDLPRAIALYSKALATRHEQTPRHNLAVVDNECWRAVATLWAGDLTTATRQLQHCQSDLQDLHQPSHPLGATIMAHLALIAEADGNLTRAIELTRRAAINLQQAQGQIFPGFSRRRLASPLYNALADLCLRDNQPEAAWQALVAGHRVYGVQAEALALAKGRNPEFAEDVRRAATGSVHMIGEVETALDSLRAFHGNLAQQEQATAVLVHYAKQMARTLTLKSRLRREYGNRQAGSPTAAQVQKQVQTAQVVVIYFKAYRHHSRRVQEWVSVTYAVIVGQTGPPRWLELPLTIPAPAWNSYAKIMDKATVWPTRLVDDPAVTALRHQLYNSQFAPLELYLKGKEEVLLIAGELPSGFPFPALIDDTGRSLVERFAFRHLVGIENLAHDITEAASGTGPSLILGDPLYNRAKQDTVAADPTLAQALSTYANTVLSRSMVNGVLAKGASGLARLPRLQSSGWEARGIASMTSPATLLTGAEATEQNLTLFCSRPNTPHLRWVHLATHALIHNALPERSALALAPLAGEGLLYVEEIGFGWSLDCDLVTLSGCQTGSGPASWSSGPLGFVQALHAAGARNLLLSTSKVDDIATALLMERFYANVSGRASRQVQPADSAPLSYSRALAEAQCWLRELQGTDGRRPFAHPVYWANFRLIGSGG